MFDPHVHAMCIFEITRERNVATSPAHNLFSTLSRLSMANEIAVRTDKGEYVGGDTIYG